LNNRSFVSSSQSTSLPLHNSSDKSSEGIPSQRVEEINVSLVQTLSSESVLVVEKSSPLARVVKFLKNFTQFPHLVAHCARKTDPGRWPLLFYWTDDPLVMFEVFTTPSLNTYCAPQFISIRKSNDLTIPFKHKEMCEE
jgi:hypothetical protein